MVASVARTGMRSMRDGRFWALIAAMLAFLVADLVWRPLLTLPFLPVPLLLAAVFLSYRAVRGLALVAVALAITSGMLPRDGLDENYWLWLLGISISALLAVWMARVRDGAEAARTQALQSLAESERRYRLLAENESSIIYTAETDHGFTYVSPSVTRALGWLPTDLLGQRMVDLIHPDDLQAVAPIRERLYAGHTVATPDDGYTVRVRTKSGQWRWIANRASVLTDVDGAPGGIVGSLTIVDDLMAARLRAQEEHARLKAVLDGMLDSVVLLNAVRDGDGSVIDFEFADANPATLRARGLTRQQLVGQRLSVVHPAAMRSGLFALYVAVVDEDRLIVLDDWSYPQEIFHGEIRHYDIRAGKVGDAVSQVSRDVTDSHRLAQRIADSEQELRLLLENSGDVVYRANVAGVCEFITPSITDLLGWTPEEMRGRTLPEFVHPEDQPMLHAVLGELASGQAASMTVRIRNKHGEYRWIAAIVHPLYGPDGNLVGRTGSWRDVSELVEAQRHLTESERRYRLLAENSSDVILLEHEGVIEWTSPSLTAALGWDPSDWAGHRFEEFTHPGDIISTRAERLSVTAGATRVVTLRARRKQGDYHWVEVHAGPVMNADGDIEGVLASFRVVDAEVIAREQLDFQARFDALTGLMNRTQIIELLNAMATHRRLPGQETAVLFADVDEFKHINDTYGHAAGDEVLRELAERVRSALRREDAAARMGGDELLIVLTGIHTLGGAAAVAEKIRQAAAAPIEIAEGSVTVTLSIGVTLMARDETVDEVVARADEAMYAAKRGGRNRVTTIPN